MRKKLFIIGTDFSSLSKSNHKLADVIERNINFNNEVYPIIKVLYSNNYADKIPSEVPVRELSKFDYEKLWDQAVQASIQKILVREFWIKEVKYTCSKSLD